MTELQPTPEPAIHAIHELQVSELGPLESLYDNNEITEIMIHSPGDVWYEQNGVLHKHTQRFSSPLAYHNFLQRLFAEARLRPDLEVPHADGEWRGFRVHYIQNPIATPAACLTLRRRSPHEWRLNDLQSKGWAEGHVIVEITRLIKERKSLLIVGPTGSGKTSILNACLKEMDPYERVIVIEDTNEIHLPNEISVKLLTRTNGRDHLTPYDQSELLRQSLRMRPDRIVVGEVRGPEAKDLLLALSTGHSGSLATLHASSARQALLRLEMLVQMGAPQWRLETVRTLIQLSLEAILVVKRQGDRRVFDGLYKITSLEETGFCTEQILGLSTNRFQNREMRNKFDS